MIIRRIIMRVQFTNDENMIIESTRITGIDKEACFIPPESMDTVITLGFRVKDPFKLNMFIKKYLEDDSIKDQVGAEIVHIDIVPPINRANLFYLRNCIDEMLGIAASNEQEESSEENEDDDDYGEETGVTDEDSNS
jgi:hypothetical protein